MSSARLPMLLVLLSAHFVVTAATVSVSDNTAANGPFWARTSNGCSPNSATFSNNVAYRTQDFTVDVSGNYRFESVQDYDGYLHVFRAPFDPTDPTTNCLDADDDGDAGVGSSLIESLDLEAGTQYVLVSSGFQNGDYGNFENTISGPGNIAPGFADGEPLAFDPAARQSLLSLYIATNGDSWSDRDGWNGAPETECTWQGVICGDVNGMASVIELDLAFNNLSGDISGEFANLPGIMTLNVSFNNLSGRLPNLAIMPMLETLRLNDNGGLNGDLDQFDVLVDLPQMQTLEIGNNGFTGDLAAFIDQTIVPTTITSLTILDLPNIPLAEVPQVFAQLNVRVLTLSGGNFVAGEFPTGFTDNTAISFLFLNDFEFTAPLPARISNMQELRFLFIAFSDLPGNLPTAITGMTGLSNLILDSNFGMSGPLPDGLGQLTNLFELRISNNGFGGAIPADIGNLTDLRILDLSANNHGGVIPSSFANLTRLFDLDLSDNPNLSGRIPSALVDRETQGQLALDIENTGLLRSGGQFSALGGLWFDPELAGSGFNFLALADGIVATYYGYGASGQPLWLISETIPAPEGIGASFDDIRMLNGVDGTGRLDAPQPPESLVEWGRMSLSVNSCTTATATLTGADGAVTMNLQQLAANSDSACTISQSKNDQSVTQREHAIHKQYSALTKLREAGGKVSAQSLIAVQHELLELKRWQARKAQ